MKTYNIILILAIIWIYCLIWFIVHTQKKTNDYIANTNSNITIIAEQLQIDIIQIN